MRRLVRCTSRAVKEEQLRHLFLEGGVNACCKREKAFGKENLRHDMLCAFQLGRRCAYLERSQQTLRVERRVFLPKRIPQCIC